VVRAPRITAEPTPRSAPVTGTVSERRPFGRAGFTVAPLAISGAYDLSPRALETAEASGVDLYFWEPGYDALGQFLRVRGRRDRARVITGTYHADATSIRADVDRALRSLRRDTLDAFLLFWTRSPARLDAEAFAVLDELRRAGKIRAVGFSTHHRELARDAIETSAWDVVMIRHSAAHPGIETALLPTARARDTAIVTFSALCYGRMLSGAGAPSPSDCYRYSLAQPGVTACISAPRRYRELAENLRVLTSPSLSDDQLAALRDHGAGVRAESQRFNTLLRQPTRDAAAAARELLASELPPSDTESSPRKLPTASTQRRSRTRLGTPRRR
jgi:diketogulonate reductase-like aldo/keto reductase